MADYKKGYSTSHALSMLMEKWTKVLANSLFQKANPVFLSKVFSCLVYSGKKPNLNRNKTCCVQGDIIKVLLERSW